MKTFNLDAMTKFDILSLLFASGSHGHNFVAYKQRGRKSAYGILQSVTREDGSGNCFILTVSNEQITQQLFVRTID